ncbi:MAG: hypothetical protein Q8Q09_00075 [Deltaproteobacteria bacterium]|nr:hypothetical protein [Deltaproteobacteria bacterium]
MQLPRENSGVLARVRFGRYVVRRLKQAKLDTLAKDAERVTTALKAAGRAHEDALEPGQDALADRDAADEALDTVAQNARANLAGRSKNAAREEPYVLIFPEGISEYIAAPVDEEEARYRKLIARVQKHLPAKDPVRVGVVPAIEAGLKQYAAALKDLHRAEESADTAAVALRRASTAWTRQLERIYGALIAEVGKSAAEAFFPRTRTRREPPEPREPDAPSA